MKDSRYEVKLQISDETYIDSLVISLVRQGYDVYYCKEENIVCFEVWSNESLQKIKE